MRKILTHAVVLSASVLMATAANAQGAYNWSGFYLGGTVGAGNFTTAIDDKDCDLTCSSQHFSKMGVTAGATGGFNHQMGSAVIGLEGDWSWISAKKHQIDSWSHIHSNWKSIATLRARAGIALDRSLIYVTGGLALAKVDAGGFEDGYTYGTSDSFRTKKTKTGLAVGAGFEQALSDHISMKGEYLHVSMVSQDLKDLYSSSSDYQRFGFKPNADLLRLGVNYRF
jgi:outer membrane immunogenic protein